VPTYRRPRLLRRALASVSLQSYPSYQVRVYDNASGDATPDVVRSFSDHDRRFQYVGRLANVGAERNFRLAMEQVDTEYFSFLSDDDLLLPRFYELTVAALDQHPDTGMAATGVIHANGAGGLAREPSLSPGVHRPPEGLVEMLRINQPAWTGTLFRRAVIDQVGAIDENAVIDLDLELRIAAHHPVVVLAEAGAVLSTENHFGKCLRWSRPYQATIATLMRDETLPIEIRRLAQAELEERLRSMVYQTGVVAARMGKVDVARQAADVIESDYGDHRRAWALRAMALAGLLAPLVAPPYRRLRGVAGGRVGLSRPSESERLREELQASAPSVMDLLAGTPAA
jgi:glycosyltransferase involved in cell wall biosynthesis